MINTHFESVFNAAATTQIIFQHPVHPIDGSCDDAYRLDDLPTSLEIPILLQYVVVHKKYLLTYPSYAASIFFVRASFCLKR